MLTNAITSAAQTTDQGSIRVSARVEGDQVDVDIADTGTGMDAARHPSVWASSMGLGLVKKLVEAHGGSVFLVRNPRLRPPFEWGFEGWVWY